MTDQSMWQSAPSDATIDHTPRRYHDTHRRQFDDILPLAEKVGSVHADTFPQQLLPLLQSVAAELGQHMMKEERVLFPMIKQGAGRGAAMPISMMMHEHNDHEDAVAQILTLTDDLSVPEGACASWRRLYEYLAEFIGDLRDHISLENNILFARVLQS